MYTIKSSKDARGFSIYWVNKGAFPVAGYFDSKGQAQRYITLQEGK